MKKKRVDSTGEKMLAEGLFHGVDKTVPGEDRSDVVHVSKSPKLIAKKDFTIRQQPYLRVIKAGEDISDVPQKYHPNLRTEGVL